MALAPLFLEPSSPLPLMEAPFGALLDAHDDAWVDERRLREVAIALLDAGCRYFVCFGERSEDLHDRIDDCIVEKIVGGRTDLQGVVTTYHTDESVADVAEFFLNCALPKMGGALVIARDKQKWAAALRRAAAN